MNTVGLAIQKVKSQVSDQFLAGKEKIPCAIVHGKGELKLHIIRDEYIDSLSPRFKVLGNSGKEYFRMIAQFIWIDGVEGL